MGLTNEEVKKVATLARIHVGDDELDEIGASFNSVLAFIDQLSEIELENVEPLTHPSLAVNNFREDLPKETYNLNEIIEQTLEVEEGYLRVPSVLSDESEA